MDQPFHVLVIEDNPDLAANVWVNPGEIPGNQLDDEGNGFIADVHGCGFDNGFAVASIPRTV